MSGLLAGIRIVAREPRVEEEEEDQEIGYRKPTTKRPTVSKDKSKKKKMQLGKHRSARRGPVKKDRV
jgi:hypothetical protein